MDYRDGIITAIAEQACNRISGKIVRGLQKMTEGMQSGNDAPLKNVWEEICAQVQGEESMMWDAYLDTIKQAIQGNVNKLDPLTKQAIWLQTVEGIDWAMDNENQDTATFCENDIVDYILQDFVLSAAADRGITGDRLSCPGFFGHVNQVPFHSRSTSSGVR